MLSTSYSTEPEEAASYKHLSHPAMYSFMLSHHMQAIPSHVLE